MHLHSLRPGFHTVRALRLKTCFSAQTRLVFTHGNTASRNIMVDDEIRRVDLLDWQFFG